MIEYKRTCERCNKEFLFERKHKISPTSSKPHYCLECRSLKQWGNQNGRRRTELSYIDSAGYIMLRLANKRDNVMGWYIPEHRLVMEQILGRLLRQGELVHHKDGDRANNHPDNLELFVKNGHPCGVRASELICPHCGKPYSTI